MVSLEEELSLDIRLSPNPSREAFTLSGFSLGAHVNIEMFDLAGKSILKHQDRIVDALGEIEVDASGIARGVYVVAVNMDGLRRNFKIILE